MEERGWVNPLASQRGRGRQKGERGTVRRYLGALVQRTKQNRIQDEKKEKSTNSSWIHFRRREKRINESRGTPSASGGWQKRK